MSDLYTHAMIRRADRMAEDLQQHHIRANKVASREAEIARQAREGRVHQPTGHEWVLWGRGAFLVAVGRWLMKRAGTVAAS
jgi:hypothetical protein